MITTTPIQSLFLLNDSLVHQQAERTAQRTIESSGDDAARVEWLYQTLFTRSATAEEIAAGRKYLADVTKLLPSKHDAANVTKQAWQSYVRTLFRLNEFIYLD